MSAPLRVVIGFPFGSSMGGADRLLWALVRDREQAGIEPHVVAFQHGPLMDEMAAEGIRVTVISPGRFRQPWRMAAAVRRLAALLRQTQPDVCVSWLPKVQTVLAPAAALAGMRDRVVFFQHELAGRGGLSRVAVALPCRWVIANSAASLASTRALWPHREGSVVLPGIDPPARSAPEETAALREALGIPADRLLVGIIGRLVAVKGHDRLLEAVAMLRDRGVDLTLLVVGGEAHGVEPGSERRLREQITALGLEDRVVLTGHVDDATLHTASLDVLVQASVGDGFGMTVVEAMALDVPVVAARGSGVVEVLEDRASALVVPTGAPGELAEAIAALAADPALRQALASTARRRFEDGLSTGRMVRQIGAELAGVAGRGPAGQRQALGTSAAR